MESIDGRLGRLALEMTEAQRREYKRRSEGSGRSAENLIMIAESVMKDETIRESRTKITRNNGGTREPAETDPRAESDRILTEALARRDPRFAKSLEVSEGGAERLSPQQKEDYDFAKLIGLSESDALKVALSNCTRG
jgi:hypothetical protein